MELMHFQFEDLNKLVETAEKLRLMYDHILISYSSKKLILNVECTNSMIFDTRIISFVGKHGGRKVIFPNDTQ